MNRIEFEAALGLQVRRFEYLKENGERYVVKYFPIYSQRAEALRTLGRWATNPELSFTWYDAAVLAQKIREAG